MRVPSVLTLLAGSLLAVSASPVGDPAEPNIIAVAVFPEDNVFQHVVNGQKNKMLVGVENKSDRNITLVSIGGSIHHPESSALIQNTTTLTYGIPLLEGAKVSLPYSFFSELRPGEHRLHVWVDHSSSDGKYRVHAFDSVVAVVEPAVSIFDLKMLATYLITLGLLGGAGYATYSAFAPAQRRVRKPEVAAVSAPVAVTAAGPGGYQEEWIPDHHKPKTARRKTGGATSGGETSGAEANGAAGARRKGRK